MSDIHSDERKTLDEFGDKYAKRQYEYYEEARQLLGDIKYLEETNRRTGYKKRFALEIIPVGIGADSYWLMKNLIAHQSRSWWMEEENLINFIRIYDIVLGITCKLLGEDNKTIDEDAFKDLVDFEKVFKYWTNGVEYADLALGQIYYGCQTDTSELKERLQAAGLGK